MVARNDREFLARVARINQALAASALPIINNTLANSDSDRLGTELIAIGEELLYRTRRALGTDGRGQVIDGEIVATDPSTQDSEGSGQGSPSLPETLDRDRGSRAGAR